MLSEETRQAIRDLTTTAYNNARSKGFHDHGDLVHQRVYANLSGNIPEEYAQAQRDLIGNRLMLIVGEVAEAHEELRKGKPFHEVYYALDRPEKPEGFPTELADIAIRLFDLCGELGIDLADAIDMKMTANAKRPAMHGGKRF